jgi:hypothetical protein
MDRNTFHRLMGPLEDIMKRKLEDYEKVNQEMTTT